MKRFLAFLLCLLMLFSLCACTGEGDEKPEKTEAPTPSPSEEPEEAECTPLMYKVTDGKGGVLYILGSIHVADDRAKDMPDYVTDAYDESDYLCVECDTFAFNSDMAAQRELAELVVYSDGSKISDHISAETYEAAKAILEENGLYSYVYDYMKPAMWVSALETLSAEKAGLDSDSGIDLMFLKKAHKSGLEIREIESVEFQFNMLIGFSDELMDAMLASDCSEDAAESSLELYELWLKGNEKALIKALTAENDSDTDLPAELLEEYNKAMISDRNIGMADKAEEYLAGGGTGFYIVGLAHVVGDGGIIDLLTQRGYTVEKIS